MTPDECLRLPGAQKDASGKVTAPGDMLIFTAGQSPIYGRQMLYFLDPVFQARAKVEAPLCSDSLSRTILPTQQAPENREPPEVMTSKSIRADYESYLDV